MLLRNNQVVFYKKVVFMGLFFGGAIYSEAAGGMSLKPMQIPPKNQITAYLTDSCGEDTL